jgi:uncharacterized protein
VRRVLYLHGFASSARSSKAAFLLARLASAGITLETPDFNDPDFRTLTISRMVGDVIGRVDGGDSRPVVLIGSSLGGFVAIQVALQRSKAIDRLVLLAPAIDIAGNRMRTLGDRGLEEWRATDRLEVFHYGFGRMMPIRYEFYTDATKYDALGARLDMPIQAFQGCRDTAVDPETVERWASTRPNVELHMLDDDHQLLTSLEYIWREMARFLSLDAPLVT